MSHFKSFEHRQIAVNASNTVAEQSLDVLRQEGRVDLRVDDPLELPSVQLQKVKLLAEQSLELLV